jgi:NAD(P)-dependent dehydrogenase (short-subunit alcohol dehydrogenase family)
MKRARRATAYPPAMAVFRKRADRIRGIAGSLESKVVLVADGTHGAGPGIVRVFAEAGAAVTLAGADSPTVDVQLGRLGNMPHPVRGVVSDAKTDDRRSHLLDAVAGDVDILIVNPVERTFADTPVPGPRDAVALARTVAQQMQDRGHAGSIVFVTGIATADAAASAVAFLNSEMEQLARHVAANAIRVNAIAPGHVGSNRRGKPISSRVAPLGHASLHPVEIGKAAWFLANDDLSSGITGSTLKIDRGASLLLPEW